jgi:hypothetical protein
MFVMTFPTLDEDGNLPDPVLRPVDSEEINLDMMQGQVGGLIEMALTVPNPAKNSKARSIDFYINEEGRLIGLDQIFYLKIDEDRWMNVAGPVFVCGCDDMGESVPLSMNEIRYAVGLVGRPV